MPLVLVAKSLTVQDRDTDKVGTDSAHAMTIFKNYNNRRQKKNIK